MQLSKLRVTPPSLPRGKRSCFAWKSYYHGFRPAVFSAVLDNSLKKCRCGNTSHSHSTIVPEINQQKTRCLITYLHAVNFLRSKNNTIKLSFATRHASRIFGRITAKYKSITSCVEWEMLIGIFKIKILNPRDLSTPRGTPNRLFPTEQHYTRWMRRFSNLIKFCCVDSSFHETIHRVWWRYGLFYY